MITPKYADDTTYLTTSKDAHMKTQQELPKLTQTEQPGDKQHKK